MGAHESAGRNDSEGGISAVAEAVIEKHKQEQNKIAVTDREVNERNGKNGTSKSADNNTVNKKSTHNAIVVESSASNSNSKNNINESTDDLQASESTHKFEPLRLFLSPNPLVSNPTFSNVYQLAQEPFTQMVTPQNSDIAGNIEAVNLSNANKSKSLNPLVRRVEESDANISHNDTNNANGSRRQSSNSNNNGSANASRNISTSSTLRKGSSNNNSTSTTKTINNSTSKKSDKITSISQYCPDEFGPVVLSDEGEDNMDDDNNDKESFYYYFLNRYGTLSNNAQNGVFANADGNGIGGQHTITAKELLKMRHAKTASRSTQRQGTKAEGAGGNVDSNANWNDDDKQAARKSKSREETNEEVLRSPLADFRDPVDPLVFVPALIAYTREKTQTHFFVDYNGEMRRLYHTTGWYHLKPVRKKKVNKNKRNCKAEDGKSTNTDDNDSTNETASITSDELSTSDIKSQKRQARSRVAQHTTQGKDTFTDNNTDNNNNKSNNKSSLVNTVGKAISPTKNKKLTKTKSKSIFENLHEVRGADDGLDANKATSNKNNNKNNNNNEEELDDDSEEDRYAHTFPCDTHDQTQSTSDKHSGIRKNSSLISNKTSSYRKNGSSGNIFSRKDDSDTNRLGDQTNNVPLSSHWSKHTLPSKQVQRNGVLPPNANNNFFDVAFRNSPILQKVSTFSRYERRRDRPILFDDNDNNDVDDEEEYEQNNRHGNSMHKLRSSLERNNNKSGRQNGSWRKRENNEYNHNDAVDQHAGLDKPSNRYKTDNTNDKDKRRSDHKNNNTEEHYGEDQEITEKDSAEEYYLDNHTNERNGKNGNANKNYYNNGNDSEYGDDEDDDDNDEDKRKMESSFNSLLSTGSGEREMLEHINLEDSIGRRVKFAEGTKYFRVSSHNELKRRLQMRRQMALEEERREWMMQQYMLKHEHSHSRDRYNSKNNKSHKNSSNNIDNTNSDDNKAKSVNSVCENGTVSNDANNSVDIVDSNSKQSNSDGKTEHKENVKNETNTESSKTNTTITTIAVTSAPIASNKEQITNEANTPAESNDGRANVTEEKQEEDITSQESLQEYEYIYEEHEQEKSGKELTSITNNHLSKSVAHTDNRCDVAVEIRQETMESDTHNVKLIKEDCKELL